MHSNIFIVVCFKHKTAYAMRISDWSSDVCSSDLLSSLSPLQWVVLVSTGFWGALGHLLQIQAYRNAPASMLAPFVYLQIISAARSEERRVGKECVRTCRSRGSTHL